MKYLKGLSRRNDGLGALRGLMNAFIIMAIMASLGFLVYVLVLRLF